MTRTATGCLIGRQAFFTSIITYYCLFGPLNQWNMVGAKGSLEQPIWWSTVLININSRYCNDITPHLTRLITSALYKCIVFLNHRPRGNDERIVQFYVMWMVLTMSEKNFSGLLLIMEAGLHCLLNNWIYHLLKREPAFEVFHKIGLYNISFWQILIGELCNVYEYSNSNVNLMTNGQFIYCKIND